MDSSDHTKHTPPEAPPAMVRPGAAAERPAGMVEAEWVERDVEDMLNTKGFPEFLELSSDFDTLEITDENKAELNKRFQMFDASKTVARKFETVMNAKLQREGRKDRMNAEERQAYRDHVAELAARDPEQLMELQEDLRALEENPEKIRQREAELAQLKESWSAEKVKVGIAELKEKKVSLEKSIEDSYSAKFSPWQSFLYRFDRGKEAAHVHQQVEWRLEIEQVVKPAIWAAEEALASTPEILADAQRKVREATSHLESAQERIFQENAVAKKIRERLITETKKKYEDALQSTDLRVLQRAAEQFAKDEELAAAGSDYLGVAPESIADYKKQLNEQIEEAVSAGIMRALESIPSGGATFSRFERALRTFIELAETEVGFRDKEESKELVLAYLQKAEANAKKGSSHKALLRHLMARLSKTGAATT